MPKFFPAYLNFTSGKLSPLVQSRTDTKAVAHGLKQNENFINLPHGGLTRRAGFAKIAQAKTDAGTARLIPFIFSTSPENSYMLEFDGTAGSEVIRIYDSSGTYVTEIDASAWFDAADVWNIRYAQSADVLYFVDGAHEVWKITRSGTVASPSFALTQSNLIGNPYSSTAKRIVRIFRISFDDWLSVNKSGGNFKVPGRDNPDPIEITYGNGFKDASNFAKLFQTDNQYVTIEKTVELEDDTYGILMGEPISDDSQYANHADTWDKLIGSNSAEIYKSITSSEPTYMFPIQVSSTIWIPEVADYHFALNADTFADLLFDSKVVVNARDTQYEIHDKNTYNEFSSKGTVLSSDITVGAHPLIARFTAHGNPSWTPTRWGMAVGWRKGGSPVKTSAQSPASNAELTHDISLPDSDWHGGKVFEIIVKYSPDGAHWGWTYRLNSKHPDDETSAWPSDSTDCTNDGEDVPNGWIVRPTDANGTPGNPSNYQLNVTGLNLGAITVTGTPDGGDYWVMKIGYQVIPASQFRNSSTSGESCYPSVITFHQGRMWLGGFGSLPILRASKVGDFEDFTTGADDAYALDFTISSAKIDTIKWLKSAKKLLCGTGGAEYVIDADGGEITPSDIIVSPQTFFGSDFVEPIQIENGIIFVERSGIRLRDYAYKYEIDGFWGDDQSIISYEEISDGIREMCFQQAGLVGYIKNWTIKIPPVNIIWLLTDQNELKGITFEKQHGVIAWHEHSLGTVRSIAVIPGTSGADEIWALVSRTTHRWIEKLTNTVGRDCYSALDHTDEANFTATAEILPLQFDEEGQTIAGFKKRWVNIHALVYAGKNISVAEGSETWGSTTKQTFDAVQPSAYPNSPTDVDVSGTGWDTELTLVIKSEPDSDTTVSGVTTLGDMYPTVIQAIHGKVIVNET